MFILGTQIYLSAAIPQVQAKKIAQEKSSKDRPDKRNLCLLDEGHIPDDSLLWKGLSSKEKAMRMRGVSLMKQKLKDPNCYLSRTRLMIRNLPSSMDGNALKSLFQEAVLDKKKRTKPEIKHVRIV